jgi:hypothetical protein
LDKHCIDAEPMLDKNPASRKNGRSAHLVLWICKTFSTVALILLLLQTLRLPFLHARQGCSGFGCDVRILFFL